MLNEPWWQGVGGIAQIFAAVLSVIAVLQAQSMMRQATRERREAALPAWEFMGKGYSRAPERTEVIFENAGLGPARDTVVTFVPDVGSAQGQMRAGAHRGSGRVVLPGETITVYITLRDPDQHLTGWLCLASMTRIGESKVFFRLKTFRCDGFLDYEVSHQVHRIPRVPLVKRWFPTMAAKGCAG